MDLYRNTNTYTIPYLQISLKNSNYSSISFYGSVNDSYCLLSISFNLKIISLHLISLFFKNVLKKRHKSQLHEFSKNQTRIGRFAWSQKSYKGKVYFEPCFQLFKKNELGQLEKRQQVYLGEKEGEAISAIRNTVIHDAENLGLVPILELTSDKKSTKDQELANCKKVYDIATYDRRQVCVTIKRYNINKPPYIQIRLFTAKENEAMKQVAYVNYTLNEFKELSQILGDFMFVENCNVQ